MAWHVPLVVCCRTREYNELPALRQAYAVEIQPLSQEQVDAYLDAGGQALAGVQAVLKDDPALYALLNSPLLLSVVTLAFAGRTALELRREQTLDARRDLIFDAYITRVFQPPPQGKGEDPRYPRARTLAALAWLAGQMQAHNLSIYHIEDMQPDWLTHRWQRWIVRGSSAVLFGLLIGIVFGLSLALVWNALIGLIGGLVSGAVGLFVGYQRTITGTDRIDWSWEALRSNWPRRTASGIIGGLIGTALAGATFGIGLTALDLGYLLVFGLVGGTILGLAGSVSGGLASRLVDQRPRPNESIRRSARSTASGGLLLLLVFGSIGGIGSVVGLADPRIVLLAACLGGISGGLQYGGRAVIQHATLRFFLWRSGVLPWRIATFLATCVQRNLVVRAGGGYLFIHRALLDHVARLGRNST